MSRGLQAVRPGIREMAGYQPGRQPAPGSRVVKLNTNESPLPPSPAVAAAIRSELGDSEGLRRYPDPISQKLRETAAAVFGCEAAWVMAGNGSDEILRIVIDTFVSEGETIGYFHPSYSLYPVLAAIRGARGRALPLFNDRGELYQPELSGIKLFFLTSPNAPLGFAFELDYIRRLAQGFAGIVVVDEAYADFAEHNALGLVKEFDNLVVTRTLSKSYGLAALRVGFGIASSKLVRELDKVRDSYNLDRLAQAGARAALKDSAYLARTVDLVRRERAFLAAGLEKLGFDVRPSQTNFIFTTPPPPVRAGELYQELAARGILVRWFADPLLAHGLRITVGLRPEMEALLETINAIMNGE